MHALAPRFLALVIGSAVTIAPALAQSQQPKFEAKHSVPPRYSAPEINPSLLSGALVVIGCSVLVLTDRLARRRAAS